MPPMSLCRPVLLDGLPPGLVKQIPSTVANDSLSRCDVCERPVWISPRQRKLRRQNTLLICYFCIMRYVTGD